MPTNPQIVDVQGGLFAAASGSLSAFVNNPVAGGAILVGYSSFAVASSNFQVPTDNYSNTYTALGSGEDRPNQGMKLFKCTNIATGAGHVVTFHSGVAANMSV